MGMEVCVLASGSSGNCALITSGGTNLLVDSGLSAKETARRLAAVGKDISRIDGALLTHSHIDHYRSFCTLSGRHRIPIYTMSGTIDALEKKGYPAGERELPWEDVPSQIGDLSIEAVPVNHGTGGRDSGEPVGYCLSGGGKRASYFTDLGRVDGMVLRAMEGSDCIVLESNYHDPVVGRKLSDRSFIFEWEYLRWVRSDYGHLSNDQCSSALLEAVSEKTQAVFLAHLSENHMDPRRDNNDFTTAVSKVKTRFESEGKGMPAVVRTFRRDLTEGRPSDTARFE